MEDTLVYIETRKHMFLAQMYPHKEVCLPKQQRQVVLSPLEEVCELQASTQAIALSHY